MKPGSRFDKALVSVALCAAALGLPSCGPPDGAEVTPEVVAGCEDATDDLRKTNENMLPGRVCEGCHRAGGQAANSPFTVSGTVFAAQNSGCNAGGVQGRAKSVYVEVQDAMGVTQPTGAGEDQDPHLREADLECGDGRFEVQLRHVQIQDEQIGPRRFEQGFQRRAVMGHAGDVEVRVGTEQAAQPLDDDGVVVGDHDAAAHRGGRRSISGRASTIDHHWTQGYRERRPRCNRRRTAPF